MTDHHKQFEIDIWENNRILSTETIDDPFITTRIRPSGWRAAWAVLFGKLEWRVHVRGKHNAVYRAVMTADYTPDPPRESEVLDCCCFDLESS